MPAITANKVLFILMFMLSAGCTNRGNPAEAWADYREQRYDKAIANWEQILKREPLSGEAHYGLGLAQLRKGDYGSAERNLERASRMMKPGPQALDGYVQLSYLYVVRHPDKRVYMDAAGHMADEVLKANPGNFDALLIWGEVARWNAREAFSRNELKTGADWAVKSVAFLKEAAAQKPQDGKVQRSLALSQELAGDLRGAAESWQRALAEETNDAEGYRRLLRIHTRLQDDAACARVVDQAVQRNPVNPDLVLAVAEQSLDLKRIDLFDRAAASFRSAPNQFSERHAEVARLLLRRGLTDEALAQYQLAERADAKHWEQHRLAAVRILMESGRIEEASARLGDLRTKMPDDPKVGVISAALLRYEGKMTEAMEAVQRVLAASPGELDASVEQARIYIQQQNYPMAIATLKMCQRTSPDYVPANLELAEVYLRSGLKEAAAVAASAALARDPVNADAQRLLSAARGTGR